MTIGICKQAAYGMGLHWHNLPKTWLSPALAWYWAFMWNYYAALVFTKLDKRKKKCPRPEQNIASFQVL